MKVLSTYQAAQFIRLLIKPFKEWDAYRAGLVDEKGNLIYKSQSGNLDVFTNLVRKIKIVLEKFVGPSKLAHTAVSMMLMKESTELSKEENVIINRELAACVESKIEIEYLKELQEILLHLGAEILRDEIYLKKTKFTDLF